MLPVRERMKGRERALGTWVVGLADHVELVGVFDGRLGLQVLHEPAARVVDVRSHHVAEQVVLRANRCEPVASMQRQGSEDPWGLKPTSTSLFSTVLPIESSADFVVAFRWNSGGNTS